MMLIFMLMLHDGESGEKPLDNHFIPLIRTNKRRINSTISQAVTPINALFSKLAQEDGAGRITLPALSKQSIQAFLAD
jgi:hypothetical protein